MAFIEAPTNFYLGRRYDPQAHRLADDVVYYDSRDLTTHAVVVGMTGSGKTGLCITLLEEAILDNVPAIVIDPKGDITNLLLTFPDLTPEEFQPWVNVDDARRAGLDVPSYSADIAQRWRDGLQSWGIVPDRVRWLKKVAQYSIYTPGSDAGLPISILASLRAPREGWVGNEEALRERINGVTTALLALIGMDAQPVKDKEHVLISNLFEHAWRQGIDLTMEDIILQVQRPPFTKLGVFPIDDYMSEKARYKLAMELNNIIAAPSFQSWIQGQPLDIQSLMYQPNGRPRVSIFYIAHLSEAERAFIITLILENMLGWMRTLSGTTSLRGLLYIDEMYGYFPPYPRNPPTKEPLLRLLKQARAFGIGLILATQNPGDLDYKGLSNAGTWFIGRLQSDNDKQKVMDGLRSMVTAQEDLTLSDVEALISDLTPRVFLMRNVHDNSGPVLVHTRWSMSYLRGPLTRQQVEILMRPQRQQLMSQIASQAVQQGNFGPTGVSRTAPPATVPGLPSGATQPPPTLPGQATFGAQTAPPGLPGTNGQSAIAISQSAQMATTPPAQATSTGAPPGFTSQPPPIPSSVAQYYFPNRITLQQSVAWWEQRTQVRAQSAGSAGLVYQPFLLAQAVVRYQDKKASVYTARIYAYLISDLQKAGIIHWEQYLVEPVDSRSVSGTPFEAAAYGEMAPGLTDASRMTALKREVVDMLYNTARLIVPHNPELKVYGNPDADFSQFQSAAAQVARENRDKELDAINKKYVGLMEKLDEKVRRKEQELRSEEQELRDRKREELFTTGEAVYSLWKGYANYTLSRVSRAARERRQTKYDLQESREFLAEAEQEADQIQHDFEAEMQAANEKWAQIANRTQDYVVSPLKKDIQLELFGIGWVPYWYSNINGQAALLPAY
jgi:hypothetical protein